jgi:hypothetical protein
MESYKVAWEESDENKLTALFAPGGTYHNTPFAAQRGHAAIAAYWQRTKLQSDIRLAYEILAVTSRGGIAHWHVTYQVTSEELFRIWAASTGTNNTRAQGGRSAARAWRSTASRSSSSTMPDSANISGSGGTAWS